MASKAKRPQAVRTVWFTVHRSAKSGKFVTPAYAKRYPARTVSERRSRQVIARA